jgi:hypothetical protein
VQRRGYDLGPLGAICAFVNQTRFQPNLMTVPRTEGALIGRISLRMGDHIRFNIADHVIEKLIASQIALTTIAGTK